MATAPRKQVPGESTTNPQFSAPQVQTAPDVRVSNSLAGNKPAPAAAAPPPPPQQNNTPPPPATGARTVTSIPTAAAPSSPTVSNAPPTAQAAATPSATVPTSTGAPPGVPATTPPPPVAPPIPPTPKAVEGKTAAEDAWIQAQNEHDRSVYDAALAYSGGPTSALTEDETKAREGLRNATGARGSAGTINSSLFGEDKGRIATEKATADTKAYDTYQKALREANDAQEKARIVFIEAGEREKREMEEAARRVQPTEPVPATPTNPGGEKTIMGPAGPGGVVPYVETSPSGSVRVGMPARKPYKY